MPRNDPQPQIEWRGGTCRVKWWSGEYHDSGRKRYESKGGFTDEAEAKRYGLDKGYEVRHGENVTNRDGSTPMPAWLDTWIDSIDVGHLTGLGYTSIIETHIRPYFRLNTVGEIDIIAYRAFRKHVHKAVAASTAKNILAVFGMVMDDAVAAGLRKASPVERSRRRGKYTKKTREKKRPMEADVIEQVARNAETFWGYAGYVFIWTMACTGMRPAELYGLQRAYCHPAWPASDPDREQREEAVERYAGESPMPAIRVQFQVQYIDGVLTLVPPKYDSYRTLVIPSFLAEMLEKLLASHDGKWVFPAINGGCLGAVNFDQRYWHSFVGGLLERKGRYARPAMPAVPAFKGKRLYLIRHGAREWLDEDGTPRVALEARMGHEVPGVEGVYSNVTPAMERRIMEVLQARREALLQRLAGGVT